MNKRVNRQVKRLKQYHQPLWWIGGLHLGALVASAALGWRFWRQFQWSAMNRGDYWRTAVEALGWHVAAGLLSIVMLGITLALFIAVPVGLYIRKFPAEIRQMMERLFGLLAFVPCVAWGVLLAPFHPSGLPAAPTQSFLLAALSVFFMAFPMLMYLIFKHLNQVSEMVLQSGYALGATMRQIAVRLILPQKRIDIIEALLLVHGRILIEISLLLVAIGLIPVDANSIGSWILFMLVMGLVIFLIRSLEER